MPKAPFLPATRDVLRTIARHDLVLATAHLSHDDAVAVVDAAFAEGVKTVVITHPEFTSQQFLDRRAGRVRREGVPDRAVPEHAVEQQDDVRARLRGRPSGRSRAQLLLERFRQSRLPRRRGRARALGGQAPRGGLRGGRGTADDRRGIEKGGGMRLLVIGAHSADFVWRAGGAIAVTTANGGAARVVALSYGERGESGELWKEPGQTEERVKEIRHGEAERAAGHLGAEFVGARSRRLPARRRSRGSRPHRRADPRLQAGRGRDAHRQGSVQSRSRASRTLRSSGRAVSPQGAGVASAFETITPPALYTSSRTSRSCATSCRRRSSTSRP